MSKIYDFKNKDIKIEFNSIKIGNSAYINQPIEVIEYIEYLQNHLHQKENIIREVREYITFWHYRNDFRVNSFTNGVKEELLEILEKEK